MKLILVDERCNEICTEFVVQVDRSLKRKYEGFETAEVLRDQGGEVAYMRGA